jgi:hypothetical protein
MQRFLKVVETSYSMEWIYQGNTLESCTNFLERVIFVAELKSLGNHSRSLEKSMLKKLADFSSCDVGVFLNVPSREVFVYLHVGVH